MTIETGPARRRINSGKREKGPPEYSFEKSGKVPVGLHRIRKRKGVRGIRQRVSLQHDLLFVFGTETDFGRGLACKEMLRGKPDDPGGHMICRGGVLPAQKDTQGNGGAVAGAVAFHPYNPVDDIKIG